MNSSGRKRILRGRIERGEYKPKTELLKPTKAGAGLIQLSRSYRKDLTEAYIADVYQRPRLPPKARDAQWAFDEESAKRSPLSLIES